jgi:hypothetical protein
MTATDPTPWIKASRSETGSNCVQLRTRAGGIEVRDSKAGESGAILRFTPAEFDAFLDGARKGEFDHLLGRSR